MKKLVIVVLALSSVAVAECPVKVKMVLPWVNGRDCGHVIKCLMIRYQNVSDKEIRAVKFRLTYYDSTADAHPGYQGWSSDEKMKPGKTKDVKWDNFENVWGYLDAEAYPTKVLFADGSAWRPVEPGECTGGLDEKFLQERKPD